MSTFEEDAACDPKEFMEIVVVPAARFTALFPENLSEPPPRNPIPSESRPTSASKIKGFPIRWFNPEMPWLPYLPAVVSYHYPIFINMNRSPEIVSTEEGFALEPAVVEHWNNIESVMVATIDRLRPAVYKQYGRFLHLPSSYGYRRAFAKRANVKSLIKPTLYGFHHMLAYTSYIIASSSSLSFSRNEHKSLYEDPARVAEVLESVVLGNSSHTLLKLLWSTLGEMHQTRNFVGAGINHTVRCDGRDVSNMHNYGVPVFVSWSTLWHAKSYSNCANGQLINRWYPPFAALQAFDRANLSSNPSTSSVRQPSHPPPSAKVLGKPSGQGPLEYVESRKAKISSRALTQQESSRQNSSKSFRDPGKKGAFVYQFELVPDFEEGTGREIERWQRTRLTRAEAADLWNNVNERHLW
jgi:hypothetical protein